MRIAPHRVVQILFTIAVNCYILAYTQHKILYQGFLKSIPQPILNCYGGPLSVFACPIGSAQQMIGQHIIPWLPLGIFIVVGAFVGRAACGWLCPLGLYQDLLYKVRVGAKAGAKRWVSFGAIAAIGAAIGAALVAYLKLPAFKVFVYGWLPFTLAALYVAARGKIELPGRVWLGGWLAAIGLGLFIWFKFEPGYGIVVAAIGMVMLGLSGRWFAAGAAAVIAVVAASVGPGFALGPLSGFALKAALALGAAGLVLLLDVVVRASLPSNFLKFAFLLLIAGVVAYQTAEPWFCKLCPHGTFEAGIPLVIWDPVQALRGLVGWLYWVKIGILLLLIVAAIGIRRPFCRVICPIGAIYSVFNKGSMLHMKKLDGCTECGVCRKVCPMDIEPQQAQNQLECVRCFECVWNCPKNGLRIRV
jgi:polyferredoxin